MSERLVSSGDICELSGLSSTTFGRWCESNLVEPEQGGEGTGNHRQFSVMVALGVLVAVKLRQSERGCCLEYVGNIIKTFSKMKKETLPEKCGEVDVRQCYANLLNGMESIEKKLSRSKPIGRQRGLAKTN